jgi:uncharacterized membrane protein YeaQ/YmgE (transglycosylase-associated protein family)
MNMTLALVLAGFWDMAWTAIVWIVIGGIAGAIADRIMQGNQLGMIGNIVVGILGGIIGGWVLSLFNISGGWFFTFLTALVGACVLLWIAKMVTGGRGVGDRNQFR